MPPHVPGACLELATLQDGVITRQQAMDRGLSPDFIESLVRAGRWHPVGRGVYTIYGGPPSRQAALWSAVHRSGTGATLSHQTAAELFKLASQSSPLIHVTIGVDRRVKPVAGLVIHHSRRIVEATHPSLLPPRTRLEETVLDLADQATTFDEAFGLVSTACQRRLTTPSLIVAAMSLRCRLRWRVELTQALSDIAAGVQSVLEHRYVRRVERPHGLPPATRQARLDVDGRNRYLDNLYDEYRLCVELDGRQAHPDELRWLDQQRANGIAEQGIMILRFGWTDVDRWPCLTARRVGETLRSRGWPGRLRSCSPFCPVSRPVEAR